MKLYKIPFFWGGGLKIYIYVKFTFNIHLHVLYYFKKSVFLAFKFSQASDLTADTSADALGGINIR